MLSASSIKKIIVKDYYNEFINKIVPKFHEYDAETYFHNIFICHELFIKLLQTNRHNFKLLKQYSSISDRLVYENYYGQFDLTIFQLAHNIISCTFSVKPLMTNSHDPIEINFHFKNFLKLAEFLVDYKNKYLKIFSEITHLPKDEKYSFKKSKVKLTDFSVKAKSFHDVIIEVYTCIPVKGSKYN